MYKFLISLKGVEIKTFQHIAFDFEIYQEKVDGYKNTKLADRGAYDALKTMIQAMPSLKLVDTVVKLDSNHHYHGWPHGTGPIEIMEHLPYELWKFARQRRYHVEQDESDMRREESRYHHSGRSIWRENFEERDVFGWRPTHVSLLEDDSKDDEVSSTDDATEETRDEDGGCEEDGEATEDD